MPYGFVCCFFGVSSSPSFVSSSSSTTKATASVEGNATSVGESLLPSTVSIVVVCIVVSDAHTTPEGAFKTQWKKTKKNATTPHHARGSFEAWSETAIVGKRCRR